jgi:hypothetical protein
MPNGSAARFGLIALQVRPPGQSPSSAQEQLLVANRSHTLPLLFAEQSASAAQVQVCLVGSHRLPSEALVQSASVRHSTQIMLAVSQLVSKGSPAQSALALQPTHREVEVSHRCRWNENPGSRVAQSLSVVQGAEQAFLMVLSFLKKRAELTCSLPKKSEQRV